jgi:hypothetical protein
MLQMTILSIALPTLNQLWFDLGVIIWLRMWKEAVMAAVKNYHSMCLKGP